MFNDLTKAPPTFEAIQAKRKHKKRLEKITISAPGLAAVTTVAMTAVYGWNPFLLLGGFGVAVAGFGLYWKLRKTLDLDEMPSRYATHMRVFAKASSPSARYYLQVTRQNRPFIMAEFNLLEREFKRASNMREQDLKSGNKRLFPPLSNARTTTLAFDAHHGETCKQFATGFPASD